MIPDYIVKRAAAELMRDDPAYEDGTYGLDDYESMAHAALAAVAADIWDEGLEAGHRNAEALRPYDEMLTDEEPALVENPYRASETA